MDVVVAQPSIPKMRSCLIHGRGLRCRLEFVLNQLRIGGKLSHSQSVKSRTILCTCEDGHGSGQDKYHSFVNQEFREAYRQVQTRLKAAIVTGGQNKDDEDSESWFSHNCAEAVLGLLKSLSKFNQHGLKLLVVLLSKIMDSEHGTEIGFPDMPVMGRADLGEIVLPVCIPQTYVGLLVGRNGTGFDVIKKKSQCFLKIEGLNVTSDMTPQVLIRIEGTVSGRGKAGKLLNKRAQEIIAKRKLHENRVREFKEMRMQSLLQRGRNADTKGAIQDIKNLNRNEYDRQKFRHHKGHDPANKVRHKILAEGSRCLNCLGEFIAEEMVAGACKFHPGYIAGEQWTCCGHRSTDQRPSHEDHKLTGCSASVHNWRPTQKRQGKASLNSGSESKGSLLRDGVEILDDFKHSI